MGNGRKLKGTRPPLPRCGACGGRIPKGMIRHEVADGRLICTRCIQRGDLFKRLPCGHMGVAGMTVYADSVDGSNFQCARCSPHAG